MSGHSAPVVDFVEGDDLLGDYNTKSSFSGYFEVNNSFGVSAYTLEDGSWDSTYDTPSANEFASKMYNREVTLVALTDDGVDTWEYNNVAQWPVDVSHTVKFFAYFPYTDGGIITDSLTTGYPKVKMPEIAAKPEDQVDYMVAVTEDDLNKNYGKVDLGFKHALSQITFTANFMLADSNGVELDDANYGDGWIVKVIGIKLSGTKVYSEAYGEFTDGVSGDDDIELTTGEGFNWIINYDGASEAKEYQLDSDSNTTSDIELNYYKTSAVGDGDEPDGEFKSINTYLGALILQPQELKAYEVKVLYNLYVENTNDADDARNGYYDVTSSVKADHEYIAGARTTYASTINPFGGVEIFLPEIGDDDWEGPGDQDTSLDGGFEDGDIDVEDEDWFDGNGNDNDFDGGLTGGDTGGVEGENGWEEDNKDDTELGSGSVDTGNTDVNGDDWSGSVGNNNNFDSGLVGGNIGGVGGDEGWPEINN